MTVKELKEVLEKFDDNLLVIMPNPDYYSPILYVGITNVSQGVNELD